MEIAFYVHHHGSGHLMRCLAIAAGLGSCRVTFLGSGLDRRRSIIPKWINVVDLPMDTPSDEDKAIVGRDLKGLHYAPLNISGQLQRVAIITQFLSSRPKMLLVVDVSVEIAMLSTLCGIPTVVIRQHGLRNDLPHRICYRNAIGLLAPYDGRMSGSSQKWIEEKTFYTGGFSRFEPAHDTADPEARQVAVLIGSGGTSINRAFLEKLAVQCPKWTFHVVGESPETTTDSSMHFHGRMDDPLPVLENCCVIIGNAGHNTVMECASLNKRFIAISEDRPFDEQLQKAQILEALSLAIHIPAADIEQVEWNLKLENLLNTRPNWESFIRPDAAQRAADYLISRHKIYFEARSGRF